MTSTRWILVLSLTAGLGGLTVGAGCPTPTPALSVSVTSDTTSGAPPLTVTTTATPSGGVAPYTYLWTSQPGGAIAKPLQGSTNIVFATANTYTVTCTVTDSAGATASDSVQITVAATPTGDPAAGQAIVNARCVGCHVTGGIAAPLTKASASAVVNNLGTLSPLMASITLTDQEVLDIKAYLNTLP